MTNLAELPTSQGILSVATEAIEMAPSLTAFNIDTTHVFWESKGTVCLSIDTQLAKPLVEPGKRPSQEQNVPLEIVQALLVMEDEDSSVNLGINILWGPEQLAKLDEDPYARFVYESFARSFAAIKSEPIPLGKKLIAIRNLPVLSTSEAQFNQHKYLSLATLTEA